MRRTRKQFGFTLLELTLVMVIIAIAVAVAAPKLRGWSRGQQLREAADDFVSMTRYARAQAAVDGVMYRLTVDSHAGTYALTKQDGDKFVAAAGDFGDVQRVPGGCGMELVQQQPGAGDSATIDFYPSGRTQVATVRFVDSMGDVTVVTCPAAAEQFAVAVGGVSQ